jgi:hypothetical protein
MKDCPSRLRTGLSSLLTYTLIKYNHSRLYGRSLSLNLHGPNPRVMIVSHLVLEGKPNANHVRARIRTHVQSDYMIGHHHTILELNSGKVLNYIKMSETSIESITYP